MPHTKEYYRAWRRNNKEARKATMARYYAKVRNDPLRWGVLCERSKLRSRKNGKIVRDRFYAKLKQDPVRYATYMEKAKSNVKRRLASDPKARIIHNQRNRISRLLRTNPKRETTLKLLGCTPDELKMHLESQFSDGMNWENYGIGGWVVDHIIPLTKFKLEIESEFKSAFHFTNLQPLWEKDNLQKSRYKIFRMNGPQQMMVFNE